LSEFLFHGGLCRLGARLRYRLPFIKGLHGEGDAFGLRIGADDLHFDDLNAFAVALKKS
jgi:hypothetical protein